MSDADNPAAHGGTLTADSSDADRSRVEAYQDYVQDQLQHARMLADHGAMLRQRAPRRIAEASALRAAAPKPAAGVDAHAASVDDFHVVERMLDEKAFYPPHDKRTESPEYSKVHHQMTAVDDKHCLVCGVQSSTLKDAASNPFGAVQMETHHHTIEWALANAIDPAKFNQHIRPGLLHAAQARASRPGYAQTSDLYKAFDKAYEADMDADTIHQWVDHAADNLWVLCDVHHRHKYVGIHAITFPIWGPQDVVSDALIAKEIEVAKTPPKAPKPPANPPKS